MRFSLSFFWDHITKPLLTAYGSRHIIEIGADTGEHSRQLSAYADTAGGMLEIIDSSPSTGLTEWAREKTQNVVIHAKKSVDALGDLTAYDTVIIDGDHNWSTVHRELMIIGAYAKKKGEFPLVILHDMGWPYGRRDYYHNSEDISDDDRSRFGVGGVLPQVSALVAHAGLNASSYHAQTESGPKNGVRTAVEDFLLGYDVPLRFVVLPGMFGYGILVSEHALASRPALQALVDSLILSPIALSHLEALEEERIRGTLSEMSSEARLQQSEDEKRRENELSRFVESRMLREIHELQSITDHMKQSKSWRWTYPMRRIESFLRRTHNRRMPSTEKERTPRETLSVNPYDTYARRSACTIIAKNYLAQARVWAASVRRHNPDITLYVLLADEPQGLPTTEEPFTLITIADLGIPSLPWMCMSYSIKELNTAVKPFFLAYLFKKYGAEQLLYFDPDILVTSSVMPIFSCLQNADILLTPHILSSPPRALRPHDVDFLKVGVYNLGFIGLRKSENTTRMLSWWQGHLLKECIEDPSEGFFVDQRWMDLVPSLFEKVHVSKEEGWNVAYWNLHERHVNKENDIYVVNGVPLVFYHFSGFKAEYPHAISSYFCSYSLRTSGSALAELFALYVDLLIEAGYNEYRILPYSYNFFLNAFPVPSIARTTYRSLPHANRFGNPFRVGPGSYYAWLLTKHILNPRAQNKLNIFLISLRDSFQRRNSFLWYRRATALVKIFLPRYLFLRISAFLHRWEAVPLRKRIQRTQTPVAEHGINMVGYFGSEKGVGQAARMNAEALHAANIPHVLLNVPLPTDRYPSMIYSDVSHSDNPYDINLVHMNSDSIQEFQSNVGEEFFKGRRTIGFWVWELSHFPTRFLSTFEGVDEIWTPSEFCSAAIRTVSPVPVITIPHPVFLDTVSLPDRKYFAIDPDAFVFLFCFDFMSIGERKNPLAVIEAFRRASKGRDRLTLIIKCSNGHTHPAMMAAMEHASKGLRVSLIDDIFTRTETTGLLQCADAYVSLHRSEGFGLTVAESMFLGKPVIATDYGATTEFLHEKNGFPVAYTLTKLTQNYGPYPVGTEWAEPDIEDATTKMIVVVDHPEEAQRRATQAQRDIKRLFSPVAIGTLMKKRIDITRSFQ